MDSSLLDAKYFWLRPVLLSNVFCRFHISFLVIFTVATLITSYQGFEIPPSHIPYSQHCDFIVPESTPSGPVGSSSSTAYQLPHFEGAYVRNGDQIFSSNLKITANLNTRRVFSTKADGVHKLESSLRLRVLRDIASLRSRNNHLFRPYGGRPRIRGFPQIYGSARFDLSGYWSTTTGQICLVGSGGKRFKGSGKFVTYDVVFKMKYPTNSTIVSSLFSGTLESLSSRGSESYFNPIDLMGFASVNYDYTLIKGEIENGVYGENDSLDDSLRSVSPSGGCNDVISLSDNFVLEYDSPFDTKKISRLDGLLGFEPKYMSVNELDCSHRTMVRVLFVFSENNSLSNGYHLPFEPSRTLVAEGAWKDKGLSFVACRIFDVMNISANASVGDCSVRINFTFPSTLSIRSRSLLDGQIWSNKSVSEPGYFDRYQIRTSGNRKTALPFMTYGYTLTEEASKYCAEKKAINDKSKQYVDAYSSDMKFDLQVKIKNGQIAWGHASPLFVDGDQFVPGYGHVHYLRGRLPIIKNLQILGPAEFAKRQNSLQSALHNVSYQISFTFDSDCKLGSRIFSKEEIDISAEGMYNKETGHLCLIGCLADVNTSSTRSKNMDCEIFIDVQFPALTSNAAAKGTIESKREKSDPFYFDPLELSSTSLTRSEVVRANWRMDLEISMALISSTLVCIFVGLQLLHVKRHPDILPSISVLMLTVLTLGHMIPLLLNFDAFQSLSHRTRQHVILESGGWLELNEVLVRVITMIAFLLEARLLQLTWSSRAGSDNQKSLWSAEKKAVCFTLPFYVVGALIVLLVHLWRHTDLPSMPRRLNYPTILFWGGLKSLASLILDAFLLPQILYNIFSDSKEKALADSYYIGTTIVRLVPHGYYFYRAHSSIWKFDHWYLYANPITNYYSTAWDIIVPCFGLLFMLLVCLQQRFSGRWILPKRFRERVAYEKVPVDTGE